MGGVQKYQFFGLSLATGALQKGYPVDIAAGTTHPGAKLDILQTHTSSA